MDLGRGLENQLRRVVLGIDETWPGGGGEEGGVG